MLQTTIPTTAHPILTYLVGATTGAALAVLVAVFLGAPFERPIAFVAAATVSGLVVAHPIGDRVKLSGVPALLALVVWLALIVLALVFVIAAIALSNFE